MSRRRKEVTKTEKYEPTPQEQALLEAYLSRKDESLLAPKIKLTKKNGEVNVATDHPEPAVGQLLVMEALATKDWNFYDGLVGQLINAGTRGREPDERSVNFMLSVVKGIKPRDQIESMLGAQMAAVHMASMTFARRLVHVETIQQQDSAERAFNKLTRTFATQVEALKRYRTGGQQKMTVEHVTVNEGGQAIVGSVTHGGRGAQKKPETTP